MGRLGVDIVVVVGIRGGGSRWLRFSFVTLAIGEKLLPLLQNHEVNNNTNRHMNMNIKRLTFLILMLFGLCVMTFGQNDYYAKMVKDYMNEAQQYLKKAENYNNKAANYLREAEYYTRKGDYDRAATNVKWASDAADRAMTEAKRANTARDNASDQMRWVKDALDKAKR